MFFFFFVYRVILNSWCKLYWLVQETIRIMYCIGIYGCKCRIDVQTAGTNLVQFFLSKFLIHARRWLCYFLYVRQTYHYFIKWKFHENFRCEIAIFELKNAELANLSNRGNIWKKITTGGFFPPNVLFNTENFLKRIFLHVIMKCLA